MRTQQWLPASAACLVVGAMALLLGNVLTQNGSDTDAVFQLVEDQSGRWLGGSLMYFIAAAGITMGIPSIMVLIRERGATTLLWAGAIFAFSCFGTAGYAALLVYFRALVVSDGVTLQAARAVTNDSGFLIFVGVWVGAFYLGELLLAIAALRAGKSVVPVWIPILLLLHVACLLYPDPPATFARYSVILTVLPLCALGIRASQSEFERYRDEALV